MSIYSQRVQSLAPRIQYGDSDVPLSKDALIAAPIAAGVLLILVGVSWYVWRRCVKNQKPPVRFEPRTPVYRPPDGRDNDPELPPYSPNELPEYTRADESTISRAQEDNERPPEEGVELEDMRRPIASRTGEANEPNDANERQAGRSSMSERESIASDESHVRRPERAQIVQGI